MHVVQKHVTERFGAMLIKGSADGSRNGAPVSNSRRNRPKKKVRHSEPGYSKGQFAPQRIAILAGISALCSNQP